jgi:tetratricopeptide (TPR) repeat protein
LVKDPTASEAYVALRNALLAMQDDSSAVLSVLTSQSDGGASWVAVAYFELRRALVQGRLQEAEVIGRLIAVVLDVQEQGAEDELAENRIHRESMQWLIDGIGTILAQDNLTGIKHLEQLTAAVYCNESLQWVAWLWTARAAADEGDLKLAQRAAEEALDLAVSIDAQARGTTLCTLGEIEFLQGQSTDAMGHISGASATFEEIGDGRGMATTSLTLARMLSSMGREEEALEAARRALSADADWEEPAVFVSQRALIKEQFDEAERVLAPFSDLEPRSPEVSRQRRLVQDARAKTLPLPVIAQYLAGKDHPPSKEEVARLEQLWRENPTFLAAREQLAWTLLKIGEEDAAEQHFQAMASQELESEIQASVLLGLGCLASRRFGHRQSSARVRAAASAGLGAAKVSEGGVKLEITAETPQRGDSTRPTISNAVQVRDARPADSAHAASAEPAPPASPAPVLGSGSKAVFTGDLQLFAVPDLLEFLKSSRRTGTLVITSEGGIGAVHMRQGMITGAASPHCVNMGDLLLKMGALTDEQLKDTARHQREHSPDRLIGSILLERGLVQPQTLQQALADQIKGALLEMVTWTSGRFAFEPDKRSQVESDEITVEVDTQAVLLDVLRQLDEQNRV